MATQGTAIRRKLNVIGSVDYQKAFIVDVDGVEKRVAKLPFQLEQDVPESIDCILTVTSGVTKVQQDCGELSKRFYRVGDIALFRIRNDFRASGGYYEIEDAERRGFMAYLTDASQYEFRKGQEVKCRVTGFGANGPKVKFAGQGESTPFSIKKSDVLSMLGEREWDAEGFADTLLSAAMDTDFDSLSHRWIRSTASGLSMSEVRSLMDSVRAGARMLLEDTPLLDKCRNIDEREQIQDRLTTVIEQTGYYTSAIEYIDGGREEEFIDSVLGKLSASGYIYHPKKNFCILTFIFMLRPRLLETKLPLLFEVIVNKKADIWKSDSFRVELLKQLEMYIGEADRLMEHSEDADALAGNVFRALCIQLSIAMPKDADLFCMERNRAMLYRYASMMSVPHPDFMARVAYCQMVGQLDSVLGLNFDDIKSPEVLASKIYYTTIENPDYDDVDTLYFEGRGVRLDIGDDGMSMSPADAGCDLKAVVPPAGVTLWNDMKVMVRKDVKVPSAARSADLFDAVKKTWAAVEKDYLSVKDADAAPVRKFLPDAGTELDIYITGQYEGGSSFTCSIESDRYEGDGYIDVADIVNYNVGRLTVADFQDGEGRPYLLRASVFSIEDGDFIRFKMKNCIGEIMNDDRRSLVGDTYEVLLCYYDESQRRWSGIASDGFSMMVSANPDIDGWDDLEKGMVVKAKNASIMSAGALQGVFGGLLEGDGKTFTAEDAFVNLMDYVANGATREADSLSAVSEEDSARPLDVRCVAEIISLIDRISYLEPDYVKSYNYLGVAKLLSHMSGDDQRVAYFKGRMSLIELIQEFNQSGRIVEERLAQVEAASREQIARSLSLSNSFDCLKVISFKGVAGHDADLWKYKVEGATEDIRNLAELVLTYNILSSRGMGDQAGTVLESINESLRIRNKVSTKKYYGSVKEAESRGVEFKAGITMLPGTAKYAINEQMHNILAEICAFLNADGGKLYLGVDDGGFECGLDMDLQYKLFQDEDRRKSRDKYVTYIGNQINMRLGGEADSLVEKEWDADDDVRGDVLVLTIGAALRPVSLDGVYYERRDTRKCRVSDDYLDIFLMQRQAYAEKRMADMQAAAAPAQAGEPAGVQRERSVDVRTSQLSPDRAFLDFEPVAHIVVGDTGYRIQDDIYWNDDALDIPVREEMSEIGWLVMGYADGRVCRVKVSDLLAKERMRSNRLCTDPRLVFASLASEDDVIAVRYMDEKEREYVRMAPVSMVETDSMTGCGDTLQDNGVSAAVGYDIVPAALLTKSVKVLSDRRQPGSPVAAADGRKALKCLEDLGIRL